MYNNSVGLSKHSACAKTYLYTLSL